ncbi:hypothetical protein [Aurantimonas coralicida]|uniref:hypothetical protein n=1 Tax=Aurantimonas coralicida TaxID=182270 RepID=UPI001D192A60|nr:hypothetical protein [Aurantimonas coralicida]MCC4299469.1 hypothetical protein [Aurantimonas coralicida]
MENELRSNLAACFAAFSAASSLSASTIARAAAGDWRFFERIQTRSFTARKYDEVLRWFSSNWPDSAVWPEDVDRPTQESQAGSEIVGGEDAALAHDGETAADSRSGHAISADAALRAEAGR